MLVQQNNPKPPVEYRFWRRLAYLEISLCIGALLLAVPFVDPIPKDANVAKVFIDRFMTLGFFITLSGFGLGFVLIVGALYSGYFRRSRYAFIVVERDRLLWAILLLGLLCIVTLYLSGPSIGHVMCAVGKCSS
jgi:hypothetical protein